MRNWSLSEEALQQAIVNTQVIDNFRVKRTRGHRETATYLAIMTRYLQSMYSVRDLTSHLLILIHMHLISCDCFTEEAAGTEKI